MKNELFSTVQSEGGLLPVDFLQRILNNDRSLKGLDPASYHLAENERLNEAASRAWSRVAGAWKTFRSAADKLPETDPGTSLTRERWLLILFQELGYGRLISAKAQEIAGKSYPISHFWHDTPIHLVGLNVKMDRRTANIAGAARMSPHSMMQEFLNRSEKHMWGFVSNGLKLRILRDNLSLTRQAYIEFDLAGMMDGEIYSDFALLWMLCHQSRVEAEKTEDCWLERWTQEAYKQGIPALDRLRTGVEKAIEALGKGFLAYPANSNLREKLCFGELDKQDYYRQILRLVYRLLFLFVAEDRKLLLDPKVDKTACNRYNQFYSITRIRQLSGKIRGSKHADIYSGLKIVMDKLGANEGCPELGLPPLGSFLWSEKAISAIADCGISNHDFLLAVRSLEFIEESGKKRQVDYKNLGAEELGSIYESLLELHPKLDINAGRFELDSASGHERKTTGSYYTPTSLIKCLLDSALEPVLNEAARQTNPEKAVLSLKICDPACGSGHFLIAAAHRIAKRLASISTGDEEPSPEATRKALRDVISHCIYGVDSNSMAVELCKVNLWLESLEPGKPLSFLDHKVRCGNSLLGTTPALLTKGIPDEAFEPITGDDKKICQADKKRNKDERVKKQTSLWTYMPWDQLGNLTTAMTYLDDISDDTIEGVQQKQKRYEELVHSSNYLSGHLLADAWCAAFVWLKVNNAISITEDVFRRIERSPHSISPQMQEEIKNIARQYQFFHWHLEFPDVFRVSGKDKQADNKQTGWCGGFNVVLGNPPWERIKLQEKEWFSDIRPDIAEASNAAVRRRMIEALREEDPAIYNAFLEGKRKAEGESHLVRSSDCYPLCGRGDVNTYAIFAELKRNLISPNGRVGCIVPSGIATDDTTKFFFQSLMDNRSLVSLYDFENREGIFPGVHRSYKFCLLTMSGFVCPEKFPLPLEEGKILKKPALGAEFAFFLHRTEQLREEERRFILSAEDIALLNPNTHTCPIFRSKKDAEITKQIYKKCPVLIDENKEDGNPWGISFLRMLDMSNDSHLFRTREQLEVAGFVLDEGGNFVKDNERYLRLYEAKMMHQFDHRFATYEGQSKEQIHNGQCRDFSENERINPTAVTSPRYWAPEANVLQIIHDREYSGKWFVGFRDITNTTNERTAIFSVLPWTGAGHNAPLIFIDNTTKNVLCFLNNINSLCFDYVARQKVGGTHLTYFILKQLPLFLPQRYQKTLFSNQPLADFIAARSLELTYTAWDLQPFAKDCDYDGPPFIWNEERRFLIRCELDALYFHLYGIQRDDVDYIMETFPIVKRKDEAKYGEYRTKRIVMEIYDAMQQAIATGAEYQTLLNPLPADLSVAHPPRQVMDNLAAFAYPHTELEKLLCAVTLELVHATPDMSMDFYLDALIFATNPQNYEGLLSPKDKVELKGIVPKYPQTLFPCQSQGIGWKQIRNHLRIVQAITISNKKEGQILSVGPSSQAVRNDLPKGFEPIIPYALKAAKELQAFFSGKAAGNNLLAAIGQQFLKERTKAA